MKKVLLISAMAILTIATTKAQEVRFGVKGGLNLGSLTAKYSHSDYRASFYVGALGEYQFADNLFGELGVQFVDNGGSAEVRGITNKSSIYQLNVPISVKYSIVEGLFAKGGLYAGYIMSAKKNDKSLKFTDNDNRFDFGLSVGAEYALPTGIFFEVGYNFGLSSIGRKASEVKNRVFQVGVGYKF